MSKPIARESDCVSRYEFIRRWIAECNVTYDAASQIYRSMVSTFEEGIANGQKITIGNMGVLIPKRHESRTAVMGFRRVKGGVIKQRQEYYLDPRITYKLRIYKKWMDKSHLNWSA